MATASGSTPHAGIENGVVYLISKPQCGGVLQELKVFGALADLFGTETGHNIANLLQGEGEDAADLVRKILTWLEPSDCSDELEEDEYVREIVDHGGQGRAGKKRGTVEATPDLFISVVLAADFDV